MSDIFSIDQTYIANTYARFPIHLVSGQGARLQDEQGNTYIDLGSGIAVNTFGVADSEWIEAVTQQLQSFQHTSNLYYTEPCAKLAKALCEKTGMSQVFFSNSGAEANECLIKAARQYGAEYLGPENYTIISLKNSFHGRTLTTLAATGQDVFHQHFQPLTPGFVQVEAENLEELKQAVKEYACCGILFELVQGEGGVNVLSQAYVDGLVQVAKENNLLLMLDEVQTGNGRTGELYAYMQYGIEPDLVSTAKGLAGGLPFGATLFGQKVKGILKPGMHGSTFGGNPIAAAGALNILNRLDESLMTEVKEKSIFITSTLNGQPGIEDISGLGLMLGIKTTRPAKDVVMDCLEKGVLLLTAKERVRLLPPLNISYEDLTKALEVIKEVVK